MGCGDVCLLNDEGFRAIEGSSRPPLINLTVPPHLMWVKNSALRIHKRNSFTLEDETRLQLGGGQVIVSLAEPSHMLECCQTQGCVTINISHAQRLSPLVQTYGSHQAPVPR